MPGYAERIVSLYLTASSLIEHIQRLDNRNSEFVLHCPFFYYEAFLCAALIMLKILKNDYFAAIIDTGSGKKLINFSVSTLRKMSVANNDLPGRLSDVLAYLWTHPDPCITGGPGLDGLQLRVKSRMSMSIVYDSLRRWREQFRTEAEIAPSQKHNGTLPVAMDGYTSALIRLRRVSDKRRKPSFRLELRSSNFGRHLLG